MSEGETLGQGERIARLERALLDLGSEVFHLKGIVAKSKESHEHMVSLVRSLKRLLDDKGVISGEDFESAVELSAALEACDAQRETEADAAAEKLKKTGH